MSTPVGPSLQLVLVLADAAAVTTLAAIERGWRRWFDRKRLARSLAQFETSGLLDRVPVSDGVERLVRLTEAGRLAALGGRDPLAHWGRPWDGRWHLVLFDVPEKRRGLRVKLWRQLRQLHFGYLQNSVWLSPDPPERIRAELKGAEASVEHLVLMEARPDGGESAAALVAGSWDFGRINRNYRRYLEVLDREPPDPTARAWRTWLGIEWKAWKSVLRDDPLLPAALLPAGYLGRDAWTRRSARLRQRFAAD